MKHENTGLPMDGRKAMEENPNPQKFHVFRSKGKVVAAFPSTMNEEQQKKFAKMLNDKQLVRVAEWFKSEAELNEAYEVSI